MALPGLVSLKMDQARFVFIPAPAIIPAPARFAVIHIQLDLKLY